MDNCEEPPRDDTKSNYEQIVVLGHSLGGLIVRRVVADSMIQWIEQGRPNVKPPMLNAEIRLFSPAIFGFRPAGFLGLMLETSAGCALAWRLRMSSSFLDLKPGSVILKETRERTEAFAMQAVDFSSQHPKILWANPDNVIITERYNTDPVSDSIRKTHVSICKPNDSYLAPWKFAQFGSKR